MNTMKCQLTDNDSGTDTVIPCVVEAYNGKIWIRPEGYGTQSAYDGEGFPILVEYYDNSIRVVVWSDINSGDPTINVKLDGALESKRKPDTN